MKYKIKNLMAKLWLWFSYNIFDLSGNGKLKPLPVRIKIRLLREIVSYFYKLLIRYYIRNKKGDIYRVYLWERSEYFYKHLRYDKQVIISRTYNILLTEKTLNNALKI